MYYFLYNSISMEIFSLFLYFSFNFINAYGLFMFKEFFWDSVSRNMDLKKDDHGR